MSMEYLPPPQDAMGVYLIAIAKQLERIADRLEVQFPTEAEKRAQLDAYRIRMGETDR